MAWLGGILMVLALLGFLGAIPALRGAAATLVIVSLMMIAWRVVVGRKPV